MKRKDKTNIIIIIIKHKQFTSSLRLFVVGLKFYTTSCDWLVINVVNKFSFF